MNRHLKIRPDIQTAELWEDSQLVKTYPISTAANGIGCEDGSLRTPVGRLRVAKKIGKDLPVGTVIRARVPSQEIWSSEVTNPLSGVNEDLVLTRLLWLEGAEEQNANTLQRFIYLHGTNQEHLLGTAASHGCIRFSNQDILEIYELLEEGSEILVQA